MFGASPRCARCDKPCYAAEQVMGPGRKIYHKPCLTCTECNKRLDSLQLVEHDREPYCKPCHMKLFGTRDLRHANLPSAGAPASPTSPSFSPRAPSTPPAASSSRAGGAKDAVREPRSEPSTPSPETSFSGNEKAFARDVNVSPIPRSQAFSPARPLAIPPSTQATPTTNVPIFPTRTGQPTSPTKPLRPNFTGQLSFGSKPLSPTLTGGATSPTTSGPRPTSPLASGRRPLPLSPRTAGGSSWPLPPPAAKPVVPSATGSPARFGGSRVECAQCGKAVYFAEQVVAAGKKWHKNCLRCSACSTQLEPSKITERDGTVFCRACYAKNFGPTGSGYALLGRVG